ncbi:hypothetical protein PAMP_011172 [Pampus punctatissimus]
METKYPTLKRPKRKLCYPINKDNPSKQWAGKMTSLEDVSKMFDDLDPASRDDCDVLSSSLLLNTENKQGSSAVPLEGHLTEKLPRCRKVAKDVLHPATSSTSPNLDIDLEIPFKGHGPVKTSSPIEGDIGAKEKANEKDQNMSPILFFCEYEDQEEAIKEPLPIQNTQCNGHTTEGDNFKFESPPSKVVLGKPKSSHKNKMGASSKESDPGSEKMSKKSQIPVLEGKGKTQRQENTDPPVSAMRQEPKNPAYDKNSASVHREPAVEMSTCVGKEMTAFLQKLRDAGKPKPTSSRKLLSPVKATTCLPDQEDEFLILDDVAPLRFSIFSKTATKKSQKQSKTSSSDKDSSTDKGMDVFTSQETKKQQELDQANRKVKSQTVSQKMKKKLKERENEVTEATPEDLPAVDLVEQDKPNKKTQQRLKKVQAKESDMAEDKLKDTDSRETDEEIPPKTQRLSEMKRSQASKYERENAKTNKAKSLKWTRKEMQGSDGVKKTAKEQRGSEEHAAVQDLGSLSDKEQIVNGKNKQLVVSEGSSSDDGQVLGKRKRNPPGQWWLSCPNSTEERKVTTNQPVLKRSKQNRKSDGLLKQRNHNTNKKKIKQNKRRNTRGDNPDKMKATVKELHMGSSEQIEDQEKQQDLSDQDMDPAQSGPLVFLHREDSFNSRDQIFQRVYHHSGSEIKSSTLVAPASSKRPSEQLRTPERIKRRRKPPGTWWKVNNVSEDMVDISSQPQQLNPKLTKPRKGSKTRSKQSKSPELRSLKKGNTAASSKPPGGAPVTHLELRPLSALETVKHSWATFKDIAVLNNGDAGQNNRRDVTVCPAEGSATDCPTFSKTNKDILRMDAGEFNHESPLARGRPSTSTVFRSGPSSMIELQQYEENDNMVLPSSRVVCSTLSVLDLCAPPLKPLILQARDKVNLAEWLKCLWPATVNKQAEITPDQFDWYFYQGRAIGFLQDLQCGSFANGKILLGSYMKKPLWVDHSATTVFNLLTSSVSVTIDCNESRFNPGQSFMVQCGHAYSIQNLAAQPAVLYFTRILAESPD